MIKPLDPAACTNSSWTYNSVKSRLGNSTVQLVWVFQQTFLEKERDGGGICKLKKKKFKYISFFFLMGKIKYWQGYREIG